MVVGFDLDGTIDADPLTMGSLMAALHAAGHLVAVLTGASSGGTPTSQEVEDKAEYLNELGVGSSWDILVVFPDPPQKPKAKWCKKNDVSLLIDNNVKNAQVSSKYCTVLVPWASIDPPEIKDKV
jgi:hypothetical protein